MSIFEQEDTINNFLLKNLQRSKEIHTQSDLYDFNPLTSSFQCYGCQKKKPIQKTIRLIKKKKKSLDFYKMNDIIIKPWHPFLREFQKIFKNTLSPKFNQLTYQQEYNKPDQVLSIYEIIRRLREQLLDNVKSFQQANISVTPTLDILATYSVDEMEINYDVLQSSTKISNQDSSKKSYISQNSVRYQLQEKKIQHYKEQLDIINEEIQLYENNSFSTLKSQVQTTIKAQKEIVLLKNDLKETQDQLLIIEREYETLQRENYFLYQYAQLDRHTLFIKLMKQYTPEQLKETDVSLFDIYLQELEKELAKLRLEKTRLQLATTNYEKETEELKKESFSQYSSEFKIHEQKWTSEKYRLEQSLEQIKQECDISHKAEKELKNLNQNLQLEIEKLRQQLFEHQNAMNTISHQHLIQRQQNEQLNQQNQQMQKTIEDLEKRLINPKGSLEQMNPNDQAHQLALIILSKEKPNQEQIGLLRQVFGEYTDQVIENQLESNQNEQAEKLIEQINDLRNFKEKLENQNTQAQNQILEIKREINQILQINQTHSSPKLGRKLDFDDQYLACIQRINDIINIKDDNLKQIRLKSQNPYFGQDFSQLQQMLLLQALTLEEMVKTNQEIENFSSVSDEQQRFVIDEEEIEESSNNEEEEIEESSIHHPEPYDETKK